ncbi:hypothetical protein JHK82_043405 [Glycine max]|nr:hypothetical protein JHK82_043405 [Glycine max]
MGNRISNLCLCSSGDASRRFENRAFFLSKQHQNSLGNSICYVRPDTCRFSVDDITLLTFRVVLDSSASFESSGSFTSTLVPFQSTCSWIPWEALQKEGCIGVFVIVCEREAGEDRVHIVICEDHGWVFVGIYDGFNGPDATDFLLNNLFYAVNDELKEMLCAHNKFESMAMDSDSLELEENVLLSGSRVYLMNVGDSRAVLATHTGEPLQLTMDHSTQ